MNSMSEPRTTTADTSPAAAVMRGFIVFSVGDGGCGVPSPVRGFTPAVDSTPDARASVPAVQPQPRPPHDRACADPHKEAKRAAERDLFPPLLRASTRSAASGGSRRSPAGGD